MTSQKGWALTVLNSLCGHGIVGRVLEGDDIEQAKKKKKGRHRQGGVGNHYMKEYPLISYRM